MKKTLTTYDAAQYCQVTPRTVVQWINEGKLKAYRTPGNHSRIEIEEFIDFLKFHNMPVSPQLKPATNKIKILIVDDEQSMVSALVRVLKRDAQYETETAFDGFEAGQKFSMFRPDIVILDIKMPGIDGYKVSAQIRNHPDSKHTKIIMMSGHESELSKIKTAGADDYLAKPFPVKVLKDKIEALCRK